MVSKPVTEIPPESNLFGVLNANLISLVYERAGLRKSEETSKVMDKPMVFEPGAITLIVPSLLVSYNLV